MSDVPMGDEVRDTGAAVERQPSARKARRVDPVSLVAGLLFIAIALAALADRFWVDLDAVLLVGAAVVSIGLAMIAGVILRARRQRDSIDR